MFHPQVELLEPRCTPSTTTDVSGVLLITTIQPDDAAYQAFAGQRSATGIAGGHDSRGDFLMALVPNPDKSGLSFFRTDQQWTSDLAVTFTSHDPVAVVTGPGIFGAGLAWDPASGAIVASYQQGTKTFVVKALDGGQSFGTPILVVDTVTVQPPDSNPAPNEATAPVGYVGYDGPAVANYGPQVFAVPTAATDPTDANPFPLPTATQLVVTFAWQTPDGQVHAAWTASNDGGQTWDAGHALAVDAAFSQPDIFLSEAQAQWGW